jgi:hypothetical protein
MASSNLDRSIDRWLMQIQTQLEDIPHGRSGVVDGQEFSVICAVNNKTNVKTTNAASWRRAATIPACSDIGYKHFSDSP